MFDDVSLSTMLATGVIFLALMLILNLMLYKPLLKFIDERNASIASDEQKVQESTAQMSNFDEELSEIRKATRTQIAEIKQKALSEAKSIAEEQIVAKKNELDTQMQGFLTELSKERADLEQELRLRLPMWQEVLDKKIKHL